MARQILTAKHHNPNIVYKTYTAEATSDFNRKTKADYNMFLPFTVTGNVIGKAKKNGEKMMVLYL